MTFNSAVMEGSATIGEILRETRIKRGLDLVTVAEETKISPKNLQAMEDGNLASLPAEVYTRGFYTMYARLLALDPGEVLEIYANERKHLPKAAISSTPPPNRLAQDVASMAERPNSLPFSYFGLIIFLFLLFGAFLCWYFGWNPASYLSEKLRSLEGPQRYEQVRNDAAGPEFRFASVLPKTLPPLTSASFSLFSPTAVTAATTQSEATPEAQIASAGRSNETATAATLAEPRPPDRENQPQLTFSGAASSTATRTTPEDFLR